MELSETLMERSSIAGATLLERDHEIAMAAAAGAAAREGHGTIVIFEGASGSGKSRLTAVAAEEAERRGIETVVASGRERETAMHFGVGWQLLHSASSRLGGDRQRLLGGRSSGAAQLLAAGPRGAPEAPGAVIHGLSRFFADPARERPL